MARPPVLPWIKASAALAHIGAVQTCDARIAFKGLQAAVGQGAVEVRGLWPDALWREKTGLLLPGETGRDAFILVAWPEAVPNLPAEIDRDFDFLRRDILAVWPLDDPGRSVAAPPDANSPDPGKRRGPRPATRQRVKGEMIEAIRSGKTTLAEFFEAKQEHLAERFGVSRETIRKALSELRQKLESAGGVSKLRQIAPNDN